MNYPTIEAVNAADRYQICTWWRFLSVPGDNAIEKSQDEFIEAIKTEGEILTRIAERFREMGGFTLGISKSIGWDKP